MDLGVIVPCPRWIWSSGALPKLRIKENHVPANGFPEFGASELTRISKSRKPVSRGLIELIASTGKRLIELITVLDPAWARQANSEFLNGFHYQKAKGDAFPITGQPHPLHFHL